MLSELRIENFAIINQLELNFKDGLVIVTGETGAGKSILLDAIMTLVGGRVDTSMVRSGADRAVLEAVFKIPEETKAEVHEILTREGLEEGDPVVTLGREIRAEGRTVARINGRSVNVGLLKELGMFLVDIHGQAQCLKQAACSMRDSAPPRSRDEPKPLFPENLYKLHAQTRHPAQPNRGFRHNPPGLSRKLPANRKCRCRFPRDACAAKRRSGARVSRFLASDPRSP